MILSDIEIGTKLELEVYNSFNERVSPNFVSQFEEAEDEQTAIIAAPFLEGNVYPVRLGWQMFIYFNQKDNTPYKFGARVVKRGFKDNLPYIKIKLTSGFLQIQRREYYRFEHSLPVRYRIANGNKDIPYSKTITRDISGGGLNILLEDKFFEKDTMLECELELDNRKVEFTGEALRVMRYNFEGKFGYEAGILFKKIENKDREAIIGFIFRTQRKLRKKGLI